MWDVPNTQEIVMWANDFSSRSQSNRFAKLCVCVRACHYAGMLCL